MSEFLWKTLSKEKLEEIINNSVSYVEVCKKNWIYDKQRE